MTDFSPAEFLRAKVYPNLDAVQEGLLNNLDPKPSTTSGSYPLTCPACKAKEGFYFPRSGYINCPRKKECGKATSIWDAMLYCDYTHSEIFALLCKAANVEPPRRDKPTQNSSTNEAVEQRIGQALWTITQKMASDNPKIMAEFQKSRGYTDAQMSAMKLGLYTSPGEVLNQLTALGFSKDEAAAKGCIELDDHGALLQGLAGRIVGYWPHPDGDDRLWGRIPAGGGDDKVKKYKFAKTTKKSTPYLYASRKSGILVCVEGTLDAWALQHIGVWGCALGGAHINSEQALFFQSRGVPEVVHMVDGDSAGWNGAISSIRNCESLGIVTSVIALGAGMDDPDKLLTTGQSDLLISLMGKRINGGYYLALMLRSFYNVASPDLHAINRAYAVADTLTPPSRTLFEKHAQLLGVRIDLKFEAARIFSNLIVAGASLDEAISNIRRRTGLVIKIEQDAESA